MQAVMAILLRENIILKRKFWKYLASWVVSPLLYFVAFGWAGRGRMVGAEVDYAAFLLPGLVAMSAMTHSFGISTEINISRFYWKTFDEIRTAPISDWVYVVGETMSGAVRGILAACVVVLLGLIFRVNFAFTPSLLFAVVLTALVFSALAISTAMLAKTHADQGMISSFIITPMAFLCGTFFPLGAYPDWLRGVIQCLPLSPAANLVRAAAHHQPLPWLQALYLAAIGLVFLGAAMAVVRRAKD